ncbi:hypothetical protein BC828DRAFT_409960 [Blastocladiella britannica]|nr:hypothetical protein BC828DRAFT_409960 [Blastocladiella britannica]
MTDMATFIAALVKVVKSALTTVPCKLPTSFNGTNPAYMVYNFASQVNDCFALSKAFPDIKERHILFIGSWMDGDLHHQFADLMEGANKLAKLSDVLKKLHTRFELPMSKVQLIMDFGQFVQGKNESVSDFLACLCHHIEISLRHNMTFSQAKEFHHIWSGLVPTIANVVALHEPQLKSHKELVTLAIKLECHGHELGGMLLPSATPALLPVPALMPVPKLVGNQWHQPMDLMVGTTVPAYASTRTTPTVLDLDHEEVPAVFELPVVPSLPSAVNLVLDMPTAGSAVVPDKVHVLQEEEEDEVAGPPPMVIQDENGNTPMDYHLTMVLLWRVIC